MKVNVGSPYAVSRLAEQIKLIVTHVIENQLWLDRKVLVTVTSVKISPDRHYADIYFTVFGDAKSANFVKKYLAGKIGVFRKAVAQRVSLRKAPQINFIFDPLVEQVPAFDEKFAELRRRDAELAALREQSLSNPADS
jgi:ribosome-binding factor A